MHQISLEKNNGYKQTTHHVGQWYIYLYINFFFTKTKSCNLKWVQTEFFGVKQKNDPCPPRLFRNSCGLENITLIKSERQKILSIFIYKNTWEYKKVAKQWGYRLKTEWNHWYLSPLLVRRLMRHRGELQDSQCRVKKRKKKITADILWSLPSAPCKESLVNILLSFHPRLFSGDVNQLNHGHVECHIMTKKENYSQIQLAVYLGFLNDNYYFK